MNFDWRLIFEDLRLRNRDPLRTSPRASALWMCGAIVEAGTRLDVPTPYNRAMIGLIKALEASYVGARQTGK